MATCVDRVYGLTSPAKHLRLTDPESPELDVLAVRMRHLQGEDHLPAHCQIALEQELAAIAALRG